jgi:hypothetical protein
MGDIAMRENNSVTTTRPLRATYASMPDAGVIEDIRPRAVMDAADRKDEDAADRKDEDAAPKAQPRRNELSAVADDFMRLAEEGEAEDSYGEQYTPEGLRELHSSLSHVKSELGTMNIQAIRRWHVQGMLDELRRAGLAPGRLTAVVEALHSLYAFAIQRGLVEDSPVIWLTFPQYSDRVRAPAAQAPPRPPAPQVPVAAAPAPSSTPVETQTPTQAMLALGGSVLIWTVRVTVTIFVLVAIVLVVEFA